MFNKNLTPQEKIDKANKTIDKTLKKRDKLDKYKQNKPGYIEKRKKMNRKIARAIEAKDIARDEIKHPVPVPKYQDNSKHTTIRAEVNVQSKNKKKTEISPRINAKSKKKK